MGLPPALSHPLLIIFGRGRRWIGLCISVGFSLKAKIG